MVYRWEYKKKGVINLEKKDQKCFFWCDVTHINLSKKLPERIKKMIKKVVQKLNFEVIEFPVQEKDINKIQVKNNICINACSYKYGLVFPIYLSDQTFGDYGFVTSN